MNLEEILGKQINSVKELKNEIKRLQDSLVGLDSESKEFKTTSEKIAYAQKELTKITKAGTKENIAAKDSIAGLEKSYKSLYQQYKLLSDEQRKSNFGKEMAKQLSEMSAKINENKVSVGNFTSNIGNYEKAITSAFQKMGISVNGLTSAFGGASQGASMMGTSLMSLEGASGAAAGALGVLSAILGVIIGLFAAAGEGIKNNEELQMRWNEAMAAFQPIGNAIKGILDKLGGALVSMVEWLGKAYVAVEKFFGKATDWLGITKGAEEAANALEGEVKVTQGLAKAKNDLVIKERQYNVEAAKKSAEVARLREEASATKDKAEQSKLLNEAMALQAEIDQGSIEIKQENLRILQEEADLAPNSAQDNEALAQAEIDVANAEARAASNARQFNRQLKTTEEAASGAGDELKKLAKQERAVYDQTVQNSKNEIQILEEKYKTEKALLEKFGYDTVLLTREYERKKNEIIAKNNVENYKRTKSTQRMSVEDLQDSLKVADNAYKEAEKNKIIYENTLNSFDWTNFKQYTEELQTYLNQRASMLKEYAGNEKEIARILNETQTELQTKFEYSWDLSKDGGFDALLEYFNKDVINQIKLFSSKFGEELTSFDEMYEYGEKAKLKVAETYTSLRKEVRESALGYYEDIKTEASQNLAMIYFAPDEDTKDDLIHEWQEYIRGVREEALNTGWTAGENSFFDILFGVSEEDGQKWDDENFFFSKWFSVDFWNNFLSEFPASLNELIGQLDAAYVQEAGKLYESDLNSFSGATKEKEELYQTYLENREKEIDHYYSLLEQTRDVEQQFIEARREGWLTLYNTITSLSDAFATVFNAEKQYDNLTEQEQKKRIRRLKVLEAVQAAMSTANVVQTTVTGIMDANSAYASELKGNAIETAYLPMGTRELYLAGLNAKSTIARNWRVATLAMEGAASLASIASGTIAKFKQYNAEMSETGGDSGTGVSVSPSLIDSTGYGYYEQIQTDMLSETLNKPIYVTVTDIEEGLQRKADVTDESSF